MNNATFNTIINLIFVMSGITCGLMSIYFIKKEPRRIANGILLVLFVVLSLIGGLKLYAPDKYFSNGSIALGEGSEILTFIFLITMIISILSGIALCLNGIKLITKERFCLAHCLPIFFGFAAIIWPLLLGFMLLSAYKRGDSGNGLFIFFIFRLALGIIMYVPGMLAAFFFYSFIYKMLPKPKNCDFVLVLGAGLNGKDKVSPLLASRLDKAITVFKQSTAQTHFIVSGGQGIDEPVSEAFAMKQYLLELGISEQLILLEDKSKSTYENMKFSKEIMNNIKHDYSCIFVTSNYHVLRSAIQAKSIGLNAQGVGGKTALYYLPAAFIREYIAIVFKYKALVITYVLLVILYVSISTFL